VIAYYLSAPGNATIKTLTVHAIDRPTRKPPKNTDVAFRNQVTGKWDSIDFRSGRPVNAADYTRGGNEVRVKVEHQGGPDRSITIGLSAEGIAK